MSGNNEEEKSEGNKSTFPLDLAPKITAATKPVDVTKGTPLIMAQNMRQMRVLTQTSISGTTSGNTTGSGISIVPQNIIKPGEGIQRTQIASIINTNPSQTSTVTIARPTHITLSTSVVAQPQPSGATYHVPRGPAVVANLAAPRSVVASSIRAPGLATTPPSQPTSFVTAVRQVAPNRTPSPAGTAIPTAWLSTSGTMQVQTGGVKSVGNTATVLSPTIQRVPVSGTQIRGQQTVARGQAIATGTRPAVMHTNITATQIFKPTTGIQSVTIAQVLPSRPQTLVYSTGNSQQFTGSPRLALTGINTTQRPAVIARPSQVIGARLAVPVSVSQGTTRLTVTPGQSAIYTTGARITTTQASAQQNNVVGTTVRAGVPLNQPARLAVTTPSTLLTTNPARFTVTNQSVQPSSNQVVIATQAGRLSASVVSLVVSQAARTIQTAGPKVITQPTQGASIQLAQVPVAAVAKIPAQQSAVVPVAVTVPTTQSPRTINVSPATIVSQRPVVAAVASGQTIPIAKVISQGQQRSAVDAGDNTSSIHQNTTNVFIHTPVVRRTSPSPANINITEAQRTAVTSATSVSTYSIPSATYFYDTSSGYTVTGTNLVARPFTPSTGSFATVSQNTPVQIRSTPLQTPVHSIVSGPSIFSPLMVVEPKRGNQQFVEQTIIQQSPNQEHQINPLPSIGKVTSSPRPSILRKRDNDGTPLKAAKNLAPILSNLTAPPISPPSRPESRGNGNNSSGGSTTISATSSPGLDDPENSQPLPPVSLAQAVSNSIKLEQDDSDKPQEMSPRKKPRKQQLTGNDMHESKFNIDDMQFISDTKIKKEEPEELFTTIPDHPPEIRGNDVTVKKPAPQLLNSYRQTWKSTHNHYLRYTDVKPKDERRPTIIDLANQSHVSQKINGWKIHHLSTQMEDLADLEIQLYEKLKSMLQIMEQKDMPRHGKDMNRINELIKGNMQRSKIINDNMIEAKSQVMKIFDHKKHVADIINRCASKRNFKKRDKF